MRTMTAITALAAAFAATGAAGAGWHLPVRGDTDPDAPYIDRERSAGHQERPTARFVDGGNMLTYAFNTKGLSRLTAVCRLGNNFHVRASTDGRTWHELLNAMTIYGRDRHDGQVNEHRAELTPFLPADVLYLRIGDASRTDGWGAYLEEIVLESDAPDGHDWRARAPDKHPMIGSWAVLGSFPASRSRGLLRVSPVADEAALYPGSAIPLPEGARWQVVTAEKGLLRFLDRALGFDPKEDCVAYAHVFVHSETETVAELRLGSDDGVKVWLNGAPVWENDVYRGFRYDQDRVPVVLGRGWNRLLAKVSNGPAGWDLGARACSPDGTPLEGLIWRTDNPHPGAGRFPEPEVAPRVVGVSAAILPQAAALQDRVLRTVLSVSVHNIGGEGATPVPVRLLRGDVLVHEWTVPHLPAGREAVEVPLTGDVWDDVLLAATEPLSVEAAGRRVPLLPPEPLVFLSRILERDPERLGEMGLVTVAEAVARTPRLIEASNMPVRRCRGLGRRCLRLALAGDWTALAGELAPLEEAAARPAEQVRWRTSFQCAAAREPSFDARADAVMIYGLANTASRAREWRRHGYRTQLMTGIAWGGYQDYLYGRFDGQQHLDDAQHDRNGNRITHGGDVYYMVPTRAYAAYLCDFISQSFDLPLDGICLEEPEFWMRGGWSPAFKREWREAFGEAWQAPDSSPTACYRAAALKKELYRRCLDTVGSYVKDHRPDWELVVATHSLINYANWGIASPESALATIPSCDTVIAQVWSDTVLTPCRYDGKTSSRPFANAYLEFAQMVAMITPTGMSLAFLGDPVADNARLSWQTVRRSYEDTVAAGLLCPEVNRFEVMPWPDRVFKGRRPPTDLAEPEEACPIPEVYATEILAVINALRRMPRGADAAAAPPLAIAVADSMMYQRGSVRGQAEDFGNFFGLALPVFQRGLLPKLLQLEHLDTLDRLADRRILLLSYNGMKPPSAGTHQVMAQWVRRGGVLVYTGDRNDPFRRVPEWWNSGGQEYECPSEHLFELLGLDREPQTGWHAVDQGHVYVGTETPRAFAEAGAHVRLAEVVRTAYAKAGIADRYVEQSRVVMRRGPVLVAARLTESVDDQPAPIRGTFIDLYGDGLPLVHEVAPAPGRAGIWVDVSLVKPLEYVASASRIRQFRASREELSFTSVAPRSTHTVTWLRLPAEPASVVAATHARTPVDVVRRWYPEEGLLRLEHAARTDGVDVHIRLRPGGKDAR